MGKPYKSNPQRVTSSTTQGTSKLAGSIKKQQLKSVASKDITSGKQAEPAKKTLASGRAGGYKPNKAAKLARGNVVSG
jgi:hypothetical protein